MPTVIGICDDSPEQVALMQKHLCSYPGFHSFEVVSSAEPPSFLAALAANKPDIVLLDIDMGDTNGIDLGEKMKRLYPDTVIIYITAHESFALKAFALRAFHYLLKPLTKDQLFAVIDEALAFMQKNKQENTPAKTFSIQTKGEFISVPYTDIFYFEKTGRRIKIHTTDRDIFYYGNLQELPDLLDATSFLKCHQGYIANIDKIRSFREKTLFLADGLTLPVSRSYMETVRDSLAKRLFSGREGK